MVDYFASKSKEEGTFDVTIEVGTWRQAGKRGSSEGRAGWQVVINRFSRARMWLDKPCIFSSPSFDRLFLFF